MEKKLKHHQRKLSRKYLNYKQSFKNKKGEATKKNIEKQQLKVQKVYQRLDNIRADYVNKIVFELVKTKPAYITIEDLNVRGMIKNRHLSKAIQQQKFYEFRSKLTYKCKLYGIELRIVNRFYPSSKLCSKCGCIKSDLKLSDRIYECDCRNVIDRDLNAAVNLENAKTYKLA